MANSTYPFFAAYDAPSRFSLVEQTLVLSLPALCLPVLLQVIEPVAVGLLRPHVVGIGEPPDLRLAETVDAHEFTAGVPMLAECLAQPLTLLGHRLVDCILGIAGGAKGMDGRDLIPHPKRIETAIAVVEFGAYLRHCIMRVVGDTDGSAVLAVLFVTRLPTVLTALPLLFSFPLPVTCRLPFENIDLDSSTPIAVSIMLKISFLATTVTRSESLTGCALPRLTIV